MGDGAEGPGKGEGAARSEPPPPRKPPGGGWGGFKIGLPAGGKARRVFVLGETLRRAENRGGVHLARAPSWARQPHAAGAASLQKQLTARLAAQLELPSGAVGGAVGALSQLQTLEWRCPDAPRCTRGPAPEN